MPKCSHTGCIFLFIEARRPNAAAQPRRRPVNAPQQVGVQPGDIGLHGAVDLPRTVAASAPPALRAVRGSRAAPTALRPTPPLPRAQAPLGMGHRRGAHHRLAVPVTYY